MNALFLSCALVAASLGLTSEVVELQGTVTVTRGEKEVAAVIGMQLNTGDIVATQKDSRIAFMMPGNSLVTLGSNSRLQITESKEEKDSFKSAVSLFKGRLRSLVGGIFGRKVAFDAKTPNAVAGVRGTYIMAEVGENGAPDNFYSINGNLEVIGNNGASMLLTSGQGIAVSPTGFGDRLTLNDNQFSQINGDTQVNITIPQATLAATVNKDINNPATKVQVHETATNNNAANNDPLEDAGNTVTAKPDKLDIHITLN